MDKKKLIEQITNHLTSYSFGGHIEEDVIKEIVKRTFEQINGDATFLDAVETAREVVKTVAKENKVSEDKYYSVQSMLEKQIIKNKEDMIQLGMTKDIGIHFEDDFKKAYEKAQKDLKDSESYIKEFLEIREKVLKVLRDPAIPDDQKEDQIKQLQDNASYHKVTDSYIKASLNFMYATNDSLSEIINLPEEEKQARYDEYNKDLSKMITGYYGGAEEAVFTLSKEMDYLMDNADEREQAKLRVTDQLRELYQKIGWQSWDADTKDQLPEKQQLEISCFEDEIVPQQEYIDKMMAYEKKENPEYQEIDKKIKEIADKRMQITTDSTMTEEEKSKELEKLEEEENNLLKDKNELITNLEEEYKTRYDEILDVVNKVNSFYQKNKEFYQNSVGRGRMKDLDTISRRGQKGKLKSILEKAKLEEPEKKQEDQNKDKDHDNDNKDKNKKNEKTVSERATQGGNSGSGGNVTGNSNMSNASSNQNSNSNPTQNPQPTKTSMPLAITSPARAMDTITDFLSMDVTEQNQFIDDHGFESLKEAVEILSDNDAGYSLSRKERSRLSKAIDKNICLRFDKDTIENEQSNKKPEIIQILNEMDIHTGIDNEGLYNQLFGYNKSDLVPEIITGKMELKAHRRLRSIAQNYEDKLQKGELSPEQIAVFEQYILSPLNAAVLKQELNEMGFLGKFKGRFGKSNKELAKMGPILHQISDTKAQIKQNSMDQLKEGVNTDEEMAHGRDKYGRKARTKTQEPPTQSNVR